MEASLIAPCGMNCRLCIAHLRDRKKCPGCNGSDINKPTHCVKCRIKNCEMIQASESKLCYNCLKFPCQRLRQLDKRYITQYGMSMTENLLQIKSLGMEEFLEQQRIKWKCRICGGVICVHREFCLICGGRTSRQGV